jgi:hypothetical protein
VRRQHERIERELELQGRRNHISHGWDRQSRPNEGQRERVQGKSRNSGTVQGEVSNGKQLSQRQRDQQSGREAGIREGRFDTRQDSERVGQQGRRGQERGSESGRGESRTTSSHVEQLRERRDRQPGQSADEARKWAKGVSSREKFERPTSILNTHNAGVYRDARPRPR